MVNHPFKSLGVEHGFDMNSSPMGTPAFPVLSANQLGQVTSKGGQLLAFYWLAHLLHLTGIYLPGSGLAGVERTSWFSSTDESEPGCH